MTVFLHTGDLHLNALRKRFPQTYLRRADWILHSLRQIAEAEACDCLVIAGDVFDQPNVTNAERQLLSEWLGQLRVPVLMISGNHDIRSSLIGDTCLHYLAALPLQRHLVHDGDPRIIHAFDATWLLLPYYGWTSHEFKLIVQAMTWRARKKNPHGPIIAVVHEAVLGAKVDSGHTLTPKIKLTEKLDVTYWALGDIHLRQRILPNAFYAGSPCQIRYDESPDKGVLLVDTAAPTEPRIIDIPPGPFALEVVAAPVKGEWPAYAKYTGALTDDIPDHVWCEAPTTEEAPIIVSHAKVPPLHGLEQRLAQQNLDVDLIPKTIEMAETMLANLQ